MKTSLLRSSVTVTALVLAAVAAACGAQDPRESPAEDEGTPTPGETPTPDVTPTPGPSPAPFAAWCEIDVVGVGTLDLEADYLPHVIQCENDGAGPEALKAQAVSARSYAYYKIEDSGSVTDGQGDQVYSCNKTPEQRHYDAAAATAGQFFMYEDTVVAAFYVAGSIPEDRDTCIADSGDADPTDTEKYVTYNEGLAGANLEQTTLGWIHPENWANRGCMSQWGSRCLDERGDGYDTIARFYYGQDIVRVQAAGPCVPGSATTATAGHPPIRRLQPGVAPPTLGAPARRIGH